MATLKIIRKRISSIRNTQQITKAMKMVSAAKLRRAQEAALLARPYAEKMTEILNNVSARVSARPIRCCAPVKKKDSIRALHFGSRFVRRLQCQSRFAPPKPSSVSTVAARKSNSTLVGRKGADYYRRRRAKAVNVISEFFTNPA